MQSLPPAGNLAPASAVGRLT